MGIGVYNQYDSRYAAAPGQGYQVVYYDSKTGQFVQPNPNYSSWSRNEPQYIPLGGAGAGLFGSNNNPSSSQTTPVSLTPRAGVGPTGLYIPGSSNAPVTRPPVTRPTPQGPAYTPQFDPNIVAQIMASRQTPVSSRPTLTPAVQQTFGGVQGPSGLAGLRGIASGITPAGIATPTGGASDATK